jgi:hypothetical protein
MEAEGTEAEDGTEAVGMEGDGTAAVGVVVVGLVAVGVVAGAVGDPAGVGVVTIRTTPTIRTVPGGGINRKDPRIT